MEKQPYQTLYSKTSTINMSNEHMNKQPNQRNKISSGIDQNTYRYLV